MSYTLLLYGATGFSGRLITAEATRLGLGQAGSTTGRMILAGRDEAGLKELATDLQMEYRVFDLEDQADVVHGLDGVDVLINAAGPFAFTAECLAKAAVLAGCHYVDINEEMAIYRKLEKIADALGPRPIAMVGGAGYSAAASNLLLDVALNTLAGAGHPRIGLGAIRLAFSRRTNLSRGSLLTMWRSLREQVSVIRMGPSGDLAIWHEPIGALERPFNFRDDHPPKGPTTPPAEPDPRIASASNLIDTLTTRLTVVRKNFVPQRIESYAELGTIGRAVTQLGALFAPAAALPGVRQLAEFQIETLPSDPTPHALAVETSTLVLEIDDLLQTRVLEWCWHTPNPYLFTARVVMRIAQRVAERAVQGDASLQGWMTPSEILEPSLADLDGSSDDLGSCRLDKRITLALELA